MEFNEQDQEQGTDYEIKPDGQFTLDEQEEISQKRIELDNEIARKRAFLKTTEAVGINIVCYSVARWLVLTGGYSQIGFACAFIFLFQQILNRDILTEFNVNYNGGWQVNGLEKIFRFLGVIATSAFMCYLTMGDVYQSQQVAEKTYEAIKNQIEVYNEAPKDQQNETLKSVILAMFVTVVIAGIYNRISKD